MPEHAVTASPRYILGVHSLKQLIGVHPKLVAVVRRAIVLTEQDFRVTDGLRTAAEQRKLVAAGVSWTLRSKHLVQRDGFGHAVDLVPWVDGKLSWSWPCCYVVAAAMSQAAAELGTDVRWGGVWDKSLSECGRTLYDVAGACREYVGRRRRRGLRAAIDGPHFELA